MKIGIFETDHFEVTYPVIKFFDNGENEITIFVYENSYIQLKHLLKGDLDKYTWIVKKQGQSKYTFIYRLFTGIKKKNIELLYLNTISNNFILYAFFINLLPPVRIVMTIHNINGMFEWKPGLSFRRWVRIAGKKWLTRIVQEYNVISLTMVPHLKTKLPSSKKVHCIPGGIFEGTASIAGTFSAGSTIHIVVPGTVDERRRNYQLVFEVLQKCNQLAIPIHMVLLGGFSETYGQHILERCKLYAGQYTNLKFYDNNIVDQPSFEQEMNSSHLVFTPTVINTVLSDNIEETYGISTCSGNIFDIVKHAKPFIAPAELSIEPAMENSCLRYSRTDDIILHLATLHSSNGAYALLHEKALQASLNYTIEKIRLRNNDLQTILPAHDQ